MPEKISPQQLITNGVSPVKTKDAKHEEMSPEDAQLIEEIDDLVTKSQSENEQESHDSMKSLITHLTKSTNSITSVPKPLKFLGPHFTKLVDFYEALKTNDSRKLTLANILSLMCMVYGKDIPRQVLKYRLQSNTENFTSLGYEYISHLCEDIVNEYEERTQNQKNTDELLMMLPEIVSFQMKSQAQIEAIDFLIEVDSLDMITKYVDIDSLNRVVGYILSMSVYPSQNSERSMLQICFNILMAHQKYCEALRVTMKMNDPSLAHTVFQQCTDTSISKQMAFMCNTHRFNIDLSNDDILSPIACGEMNTTFFKHLATELDVLDPKTPEDIFKKSETRTHVVYQIIKRNLGYIYVNAFVNAGFGKDEFMTQIAEDRLINLYPACKLAAAASLGSLFLWNTDETGRAEQIAYNDKNGFLCGTMIATGMTNTNVITPFDLAFAMLSDKVESQNESEKLGAIIGLGFAYAGTNRKDILEILIPCLLDEAYEDSCNIASAFSLGLIFVGSCDQFAAEAIVQFIFQLTTQKLKADITYLYIVALGLIFLGQKEACEPCLLTLQAAPDQIRTIATVIVEGMAFIGTGDISKVNSLLDDFFDNDSEQRDTESALSPRAFCFINIALITMGDQIGTDMVVRLLDHVLQNEDEMMDPSAPLALALCSISNPQQPIVDTLYKLSHSTRSEIALNAFFGLGLVGAGTNNSRVGGLLRQSSQNPKNFDEMFLIRIAQGLLHMSKGLVTINPVHSEKFLINKVAVSGLILVIYFLLPAKATFLTNYHYFFYYLNLAITPRMLLTVDESLEPLPVLVRVGQGVDTVAQAGNLKTVTGFQTHTTPVLLGANERAELATDEYIPLTSILEGVVIIRKNPNYKPEI